MLQKVVDYRLVMATSASRLTNEVKSAMTEGWVPSGTVMQFNMDLIQAMVKFEAVPTA